MVRSHGSSAVRPITDAAPLAPASPPRLGLIAAVLVAGAIVGWLVAQSGEDGGAPPAVSNDAGVGQLADAAPASAAIDWSTATAYPLIPAGHRFDGFTGVAEVADSIYVTANLYDAAARDDRAVMWRSADGEVWEDVVLDLGAAVEVDNITAYGDSLLVAGTRDGDPVVWRSIPERAIGGASWNEISLDEPSTVEVQEVSLAANRYGQIVVVASGVIDLTDRIVEPYLPPGIDLSAGRYRYYGDRWLVATAADWTDHPNDIEIFAETPEVMVAGNRAWTRVVTSDGVEHLATFPLPDDQHYPGGAQSGTTISAVKVWASGDAGDFHTITGPNIVPSGRFEPVRWGDRFVAAEYGIGAAGPDDATVIWESSRGTAWRPIRSQPPGDCVPFSLAVSGNRLLALSDGGVVCVRNGDAAWQMLGTRQSGVGYLTGGDAGFLRYPLNNDYGSSSFSRDGVSWASTKIAAAEPYPMIAVLHDRLVTLSVEWKVGTATQVRIWIGEIG